MMHCQSLCLVYMKFLPMNFHFVFLVGCIVAMIALEFYALVHSFCVIVEAASVIVLLVTLVTLKHFPIVVEDFPIRLCLQIFHRVSQCLSRLFWFIFRFGCLIPNIREFFGY